MSRRAVGASETAPTADGPERFEAGALRGRSEYGVDSGGTAVPGVADDEDLRQQLDFHLTIAVIGLVGG